VKDISSGALPRWPVV